MASFVKIVCFVVNYAIFHELCDRMRFAVDCAKTHHRVISEGLTRQLDSRRIHTKMNASGVTSVYISYSLSLTGI